jgi:hypothetical protein
MVALMAVMKAERLADKLVVMTVFPWAAQWDRR